MADPKTTERTDRERMDQAAERTYARAEDTMSTMFDNNRRAIQAMMAYNRNSIETTMRFARDIQEESLRLTDAWFDQLSKFQRNNMSLFQDYNKRFQDYTERTVKDSQSRIEENVDQSLDLVTPAVRPTASAGRR